MFSPCWLSKNNSEGLCVLSGCFSEFLSDTSYNNILSLRRASTLVHEQKTPGSTAKPLTKTTKESEKIDQLQTDDSCDKLMENAWAGQHFHTVVCSFIAEFSRDPPKYSD